MTLRYLSMISLCSLSVLACSSNDDDAAGDADGLAPAANGGVDEPADDDPPSGTASGDGTPSNESEPAADPTELSDCTRGTLEPDLQAAPLDGPGVSDGALIPGDHVVSSTYLQIGRDAASRQLFEQLVAPVTAELQVRPGLLALSFGSSESCGTVRTLSVWEDDVAMLGFVTSTAHANAMARVTEISRGGSVVTHWTGDAATANWPTAAQRLGEDDGPEY
jgi:hypothetical protein